MDDNMEMDTPVGGGSFDQSMGQTPQQQEPQEDFEADFDAGVEANEEDDPKKYIQQLTGKLSQSLRKYNEGLPKPDAELSKYVAGMIIKQAVEGLSQEDVTDIMDKVENDGNEEDMEQAEQQPMDNEQPEMQPDMNQQPEAAPMNETTGSTVDATDTRAQKKTTKMRKGGYSRKPYIASI
jgi:hypothetical protein